MKNETCNRCRIKYSLIECDNCKETFCSECDSYIHSIISKKDHIRKMIYSESTHDTISKLNSNYEPKNFINNLEFSQYNTYDTNRKNILIFRIKILYLKNLKMMKILKE